MPLGNTFVLTTDYLTTDYSLTHLSLSLHYHSPFTPLSLPFYSTITPLLLPYHSLKKLFKISTPKKTHFKRVFRGRWTRSPEKGLPTLKTVLKGEIRTRAFPEFRKEHKKGVFYHRFDGKTRLFCCKSIAFALLSLSFYHVIR